MATNRALDGDDICDSVDVVERDKILMLKSFSIDNPYASYFRTIYALNKAIESYDATKLSNQNFVDILSETQNCITLAKASLVDLNEKNTKKSLQEAQKLLNANNKALDALNCRVSSGFSMTMNQLTEVDVKIQNIANKLEDSTAKIVDKIESATIIKLELHDSRTEKILADLSTFLEFITCEAAQIQSLPLHLRIEKIKIDKGFIDLLSGTRNADQPMLSLLTEIIDFGIAIPKYQRDTASLAMLELLCHGVDVYMFIMTFLIHHYAILAVDYFYKSDLDSYNAYMSKCASVYKDFSNLLLQDNIGLVSQITNRVLNNITNGDFISANQEAKQLVGINLYKFDQIRQFFTHQFNSDVERQLLTNIKFNSTIATPILDWKKYAYVSYASQGLGAKDTSATQVSGWKGITVDDTANPYITIDPDNSNRIRVIHRKFNNGDSQIVSLITNSDQSGFQDIDRDLYNAAHEPNGDMAWKIVQIYLNNSATNVSAMFEHAKRAIHVAAENNNWQVAQALIDRKNGSNVNQIDDNGFTPLYIAARAGYEQFVDNLIELKADVNLATGLDNHHFTPLHSAVFQKHANIVKKLLQVPSIDIHARTSNGLTSFNLAVLNNEDEIIDIYLNSNKNIHEIVDIQSVSEFPPIYFAYRNKNTVVANKLIDQCANVNIRLYDDKTLLHLAVMYGDLDVFKKLIKQIGRLDVKDVNGRTPLHYAVMYGNEELTGFLLDNHVSPDEQDSNGTPVIIFTANLPEDKALTIIRALVTQVVSHRVDINAVNRETKNTILHIACALGYLSAVKFLLENHANVNLMNNKKETPLHMASEGGHFEIVKCLLDSKADVNVQNEHGETPLHLASKIGHLSLVKSLINRNANFTFISDTDETPLEYAVKGDGDLDMFKYFIALPKGEDPWKTDRMQKIIQSCSLLSIRTFKNDIFYYGQYFDVATKSLYYNRIIEALTCGNFEIVKFTFENYASWIDGPVLDDSTGWTVLYYATMGKGGLELVNYIIESQPKYATLTVDDKKYGKTLLHLAIETKKVTVALLLLDKKADFYNADFEGDTQLHYASKYGLIEIVHKLIPKLDYDSIDKRNKQGKTPLFVGVEGEGNLDLIEYIIYFISNWYGDNDGQSLLDAAIVANKSDVFLYINWRLPINPTNLHVAASNSNIELVDLLVDAYHDKKIDINLEDSQKRKPIYYAVEGNGTLAMIQHLVSKQADITHFDATRNENLITLAIAKKKFDIAMYLIGCEGADVNTAGISKISPLYQAVYVDNSVLVAALLKKGADYNFKLPNGTIPIDLIVDNKSNTIKYFTMMYRNDQNQTMLHLMAALDRVKVVRKLLERGAYVNAQDKDGNSPLHLAAKNGQLETVKIMCERKQKCLNVELKNANQQTASDLAKSNHYANVVDYLEHNCQPNQRERRQIDEQFSEPPVVSSSASRPSWWVKDLIASAFGTFGSITKQTSMLSPSYHESRSASAQSISSLSASVNVHSTLLLLDVLARKFTGQSYIGTNSQSGSPLDARSNSLVIVQQFEKMLTRLANETNSQLVSEFDSFELYRSVEQCLLSSQYSKIDRILLSTARNAFPYDLIEDSLLVMSVEELLNEVLLCKKDSSLVETSSTL